MKNKMRLVFPALLERWSKLHNKLSQQNLKWIKIRFKNTN